MEHAIAVQASKEVNSETLIRRVRWNTRQKDMLGAMRYLLKAWPQRASTNTDMCKKILREEYRAHIRKSSWGTPIYPKTTAHLGKLTAMETRAVTRVVKTLLVNNILMQKEGELVSFREAKSRLKEINLKQFGIAAKVIEESGGKPTLALESV